MVEVSAPDARPLGFRAALDKLGSAQKSSKGAPVYSLYVNRPLGRVFAAAAFQLNLTPNHVTAVSAILTFSGIVLLAVAPAVLATGLCVALLLVLGYGLDAADGQLARLRGGGSAVGEWLDHLTDSVKVVVLHLAVAISWYRFFDLASGWLLVPLVFTAASSVHFFGMILIDLLARERRAASGAPAPVLAPSRLKTIMKLPMDYGFLCLIFCLLGSHLVFTVAYTFLAVGSTGYLVLVVRKWTDDVRAMTAPQ